MAFFSLPVRGDLALQEDLNRFLRSHRVLTVHREFVGQGDNSFWALAVEYMEGPTPAGSGSAHNNKQRVDYKAVLAPSEFVLFAKLRDWRKITAEQEGVPVYALFTNEQLAVVASKRPSSVAQLREIEGVGEAKVGKYSAAVLNIVSEHSSGDGTGGLGSAPVGAKTETDATEAVPPRNGGHETRR